MCCGAVMFIMVAYTVSWWCTVWYGGVMCDRVVYCMLGWCTSCVVGRCTVWYGGVLGVWVVYFLWLMVYSVVGMCNIVLMLCLRANRTPVRRESTT